MKGPQHRELKQPRRGFANPYKNRERAERMAEILTQMYRNVGLEYVVVDFEATPRSWVILPSSQASPE